MNDISNWSQTAASNNSASPDGYPESMAPSGLNNSDRETMARVREFYDQIGQDDFVAGLTVSINSSDADHDIDVTTGVAWDGAAVEMMDLGASTYVKKVDATWSVGSAAGGLDTGSVAADKRYYIWVVKRVDTNVVDILISLSSSSPTMPTSYTLKRLIGTGVTDASSNWVTGSVIPANRPPILSNEGAVPGNGDMLRSVTNTVTAGSTQTQAGATELLTSVNRVTVSGTNGDGVELPTAVAGAFVTVINDDSAQTIQIWPSTSDQIDGASANAVDAVALSAGRARTYIAVDTTNWYTIAESGLATPVSVANGGTGASTLTDGGVLLGSGTNAVEATAVLADGEMLVGDGSTDPALESGDTLRTSIMGAIGPDLNTLGAVSSDGQIIVGTGSGVFAYESGSTLRNSVGVGTGDSPTFTNLTLSGFEYRSLTNTITAGSTQTQAGATALTKEVNRVTVSGSDGDGVKLPTAVAGAMITIINDDAAQTIKVWPATSDAIDGGSANAVDSNTLTFGSSREYFAVDATNWYTVTPASAAAGLSVDAISGIIDTDGTYIDFVVFGPALDPVKDWNERTSATTASLMLATIKDAGSDTTVEIWDLTDSAVVGGSAIGSVTLSGAATPTSIAAGMGYILVGHEDGTTIIDPHDGAWAARTIGHPKSLSTSTNPALNSNDVVAVAVGYEDVPTYDPRTGGPMPTFAFGFAANSTGQSAFTKSDGTYISSTLGSGGSYGSPFVAIQNGRLYSSSTSDVRIYISRKIAEFTANAVVNAAALEGPNGLINVVGGRIDGNSGMLVRGTTGGLDIVLSRGGIFDTSQASIAQVTRAYNTGLMFGDGGIKGAWLANDKTADRSGHGNSLTENSTVTEGAFNSGDLKAYSGFSATVNFTAADNAEWNALGTHPHTITVWFKSSGNSAVESYFNIENSATSVRKQIFMQADGTIRADLRGATTEFTMTSTDAYDDGLPHRADFVTDATNSHILYIDGVVVATSATTHGSISGTILLAIGVRAYDGSTTPATSSTLALARIAASAPAATEIRQAYELERRMFDASAKCLLQSGSTDSVLDARLDPITENIIVTQTDDQVIFDGLIISNEPSIASGGSTWEHGALYGGDRFEINDANLYATIAAKDLQQELETVRGLRSSLPKGVDLSKAKVWIKWDGTGTINIESSMNVKSLSDDGTGLATVTFSVPFKNAEYVQAGCSQKEGQTRVNSSTQFTGSSQIETVNAAGTGTDSDPIMTVFFGELENE